MDNQKSWFARHKILTGILGFFLFIIVVGGCGNTDTQNTSSTSNDSSEVLSEKKKEEKSVKKAEEKIEYIKVTANDLCSEYESDEIAADKKFKGKYLEVTGIVDRIDSSFTDSPIVGLKCGGEYSLTSVGCSFTSADEAAELSKGTSITIQGKSSGEVIGSPQISDCKIKK